MFSSSPSFLFSFFLQSFLSFQFSNQAFLFQFYILSLLFFAFFFLLYSFFIFQPYIVFQPHIVFFFNFSDKKSFFSPVISLQFFLSFPSSIFPQLSSSIYSPPKQLSHNDVCHASLLPQSQISLTPS